MKIRINKGDSRPRDTLSSVLCSFKNRTKFRTWAWITKLVLSFYQKVRGM